MTPEPYAFLAMAFFIAAAPALAVARMSSLDRKPLWIKTLVFAGTAAGLFPFAGIAALLVFGWGLGIDVLD